MKKPLCSLLFLVGLPLIAQADNLRPLRNAPAAFQTECGSCHVAFPPQLLGATDWQKIMRALDKHYGDNASLDEPTRKTLEEFLVRNAGSSGRGREGQTRAGESLPRLTQTAWFTREHREVPRALWGHAKVKTAANCTACHTKAAAGSYRENEIVSPDGRRRNN
jgi:mono/diheme cytochrome c family protein